MANLAEGMKRTGQGQYEYLSNNQFLVGIPPARIEHTIEFNLLKEEFKDKAHFVYSDDIWEDAVSAFNCDL